MPATRLSPLDASFLRAESASAHMHVGFRARFGRDGSGAGPPTVAKLHEQIAGRLELAPRFRQRLAYPPAGLGEPVWVDDEQFALERHIGLLGAPGQTLTHAQFVRLADEELSRPLPRDRPLWTARLAPSLSGGEVGLVMKAHHALVDGVSAVSMALLLLDAHPDAEPAPAAPWAPAPTPSTARLALGALADRAGESLRLGGGLLRAASDPSRGARRAGTLRRAALSAGEDLLRPAPSSFVNVPIGPQRTLTGYAAELEPLLAVKRRQRVTLNDVVLTIMAGALRQIALSRGERPGPLKTMVPVSRRDNRTDADPGNRISFVFIDLPTDRARPVDRLASVCAATAAFKRGGRAAGSEAILAAVGVLPPVLQAPVVRLASSARTYNLTISNVPGPRVPVYLFGGELLEALPVIPLPEDHALAVGVLSLQGRLCFGVHADPEAFPEAGGLAHAIASSTLEVTHRLGPAANGRATATTVA